MELGSDWIRLGQWVITIVGVGLSLSASGHALVYKRDPRAAILWLGIVWLIPLFGVVLYFSLGVNRIKRLAESMRGRRERSKAPSDSREVTNRLCAEAQHLGSLVRAVDAVVSRPLLPGNRVEPLKDGDEAYPAMLEAIATARTSVSLSTYIFDADEAGRAFAAALGEAVRRGVEIRVLIDAAGTRYSWPPIMGDLRRAGVTYARFLRLFPIRWLMAMNLRNHRKILVADGRVGFTGGLNLRIGHWLGRHPSKPVRDLHFRVEGPVVAQLQEAFVDDWQFTTGELLRGETWFPPLHEVGSVVSRSISDGPDEDFDKLRWTLLAALASARSSIRVATPYFLPDAPLMAALNVAALRGVHVDIVLPSRSNLPVVHEASRALWWQVLQYGCRIWLSPPPFDHTKLMIVDDVWAFVGSANWDPRSLRLNFEFNLECYDANLAQKLITSFEAKRAEAKLVTLADVDGRSLYGRLRDGLARLFTPFL